MNYLKKHWLQILEWLYLVSIFRLAMLPMRDFDIWFHLKSGELFVAQKSLQFTDVFSYAAEGRKWFPYEWLFQVVAYLLSLIGFWTLPIFVALFATLMQWAFMRILKLTFGLSLFPRIILSFVFFVSVYEYHSVRPHVLAYSFVAVLLFMIFARVFKGKRYIFFSPIMTLVWTNLHASNFLSWGLPLAYASVVLVWWIVKREKNNLLVIRDLLGVTLVNAVVTILPPLGFTQYELLWMFFKDRVFLAQFIGEWGPITDNEFGFYTYSVMAIVCFGSFAFVAFRKKDWHACLWVLPLILMAIMGYVASRNVVMGTLGMLISVGYSLSYLFAVTKTRAWKYLWIILCIIVLLYYSYTLLGKSRTIATDRLYYPVKSAEFAKKYLHGHMFNDYAYGGYLLYNLYPTLQVFFDGRSDVYLCCEMRDYFQMSQNKNLSDDAYKTVLYRIWDKYDISFIIAPTRKHNVWRKVTRVLSGDPNWALVFWDDDNQIFVRRDGKNDDIITKLDNKAATPYLRDPFPKDQIEQALFEYERMDKVTKTARTSNALGYIYLQNGEYEKAKTRFLEAIDLDPTFESPYMNLAELAAKDNDLERAVVLYGEAQKLAPDRGLIYIRMGQLYLARFGDKNKVKKLWENGINNTVDEDAKTKLKELLQTL